MFFFLEVGEIIVLKKREKKKKVRLDNGFLLKILWNRLQLVNDISLTNIYKVLIPLWKWEIRIN